MDLSNFLKLEFITPEEEKDLINFIQSSDQLVNKFSDRKSKAYGYQYIKGQTGLAIAEPIPDQYLFLIDRLENLLHIRFNQITINEYQPGQGIDAHYDHKTIFGNEIAGLTLGSGCNFILHKLDEYNRQTGEKLIQYLPPRSLYLMKDEFRYHWTHKIQKSISDMVDGHQIQRGTRWSLTFRTALL